METRSRTARYSSSRSPYPNGRSHDPDHPIRAPASTCTSWSDVRFSMTSWTGAARSSNGVGRDSGRAVVRPAAFAAAPRAAANAAR
jgi:hypothetical protein